METIEIGAVKLDGGSLRVTGEFSTFVRPVDEPDLSEFCTSLTSIRQTDVDSAPRFPEALESFLRWAGPGHPTLCSWGDYDRRQLEIDCRRHRIDPPPLLSRHLNLKRMFAEVHDRPPCGMRHALRLLSLELVARIIEASTMRATSRGSRWSFSVARAVSDLTSDRRDQAITASRSTT